MNISPSIFTVIVPGVMVIEFARMALAVLVFKLTFTSTIAGVMGILLKRIIDITLMFDRKIAFKRTKK